MSWAPGGVVGCPESAQVRVAVWSLGSVAVGDDETVEEATTVDTTLGPGASTAVISDEHDAISSNAAAS
jgi:hypothetical protein